MNNRSNTRWGSRQPPRRGGSGSSYDQNYNDYNYGHHQYSGSSYDYESYDQSQSNYDRGSASSKRYSSNRNTYDGGNHYYNPPPRHAKGNFAENNNNNNKTNSSVNKKPTKQQEPESSSPIPSKEQEMTVEIPSISLEPKIEQSIETPPIEDSKPIETPVEELPLPSPPPPTIPEPPPEENLDLIRQQITSYLTERNDRLKQRQELREQNLNAEKNRLNAEQQQAAMTRLDSSIKRIPPFIKRLRTLTEQQRDALCRDMQTLNLTRYISEVATALTEAKLKMSDVWTSVQICSLLHQRYPDFSLSLYENWLKVLQKETLTENLSKVRVDLRLFAELITVHVLPINQSINHLLTTLTALINNDKDFSNLTILISFCRLCGEDYADIFSSKIRKLIIKLNDNIDDLNKSIFHSNELKQQIRTMLNDYFQKLSVYLIDEYKQLQKQEQLMKRTMENRGEINQEIKDKYEQANTTFQKLLQNTETMADLLEQPMPELPIEEVSKKSSDRTGIDFYLPGRSDDDLGGNTIWEDSETKQFYEDTVDLKLFLPGYAFREPITTTTSQTSEETETVDSVQMEQEIEKEALEVTSTTDADEEDTTLADIEDGTEEDVGANNIKLMMDVFVAQLPTCVNREMIDKGARDFATNLNTKQNRKRLIKALYTVQRTYLHLLPFYSRLVATLYPIMPEIGNELVRLLKNEFRAHIRRKDQIYIESKIKTVRFIGELVKFNVFPKNEAINCLKTLLSDFRHHNIEMCCNLLETCGRFLYRSPDCHRRTEIILEILMRKKAVLTLDSRYITQIENAYYYCNPPETREIEKKIRSPIQEYIRRLLFKDLNKMTVEKILRQIRKFNWFDSEFRSYAIKCLAAPYSVKFNSIQCLASILSGLSHFYDDVAIEVFDNVLDDIRLGLEVNIPKFNQRRLCMIKYLGEMYNYRVVDSIIIFRTLYLLITYGVSLEASEIINELDPPEHLFRIRLICTLLDTCGQYFDRGTSKKRLDCFLNYFQRYYYFKKEQSVWNSLTYPFPLEIEHIFDECVMDLRPKFNRANSYAKACEQVENMEKEFITLINEQQSKLVSKDISYPSRDTNLAPITEDEELSIRNTNEDDLPNSQRPDDEDDEDQEENNEEEEDNDDDDDERHRTVRSRRSRPSAGSRERTSGGSGADEEYLDTDDNDTVGFDDENNNTNKNSIERTKITTEEDTEFIKAYDALVAESVAQRSNDLTKISAPDIPVPIHLRKNKIPSTTTINISQSDGDDEGENNVKKPETVNFVVMLKKNNKPQFYNMAVSSTSEMALKLKAREQADREEKAQLKILTLNMSTRMEQQENEQDSIMNVTNRTPPAPGLNFNREKKPKYIPPKGAPDADAIFGPKKR
ncbi:unnamed protein product [Rotaria sordida]|uniref:MIF4G domain-containing protein n=1 Tax=Rotaria sordida TaxID=392033 RepID=A0A815HWY8_9BILA|nr:unnamed protein product [Rotaria sordida]